MLSLYKSLIIERYFSSITQNVFIYFDNSIELEQEVNTSITIIPSWKRSCVHCVIKAHKKEQYKIQLKDVIKVE